MATWMADGVASWPRMVSPSPGPITSAVALSVTWFSTTTCGFAVRTSSDTLLPRGGSATKLMYPTPVAAAALTTSTAAPGYSGEPATIDKTPREYLCASQRGAPKTVWISLCSATHHGSETACNSELMPISTTTTSPVCCLPSPMHNPSLAVPKVTVRSAARAWPGISPVSELTPEGISQAISPAVSGMIRL